MRRGSRAWPRVRSVASWALAVTLLLVGLPTLVGTSWQVTLDVLGALSWEALLGLGALWLLGLVVHSFVLTAAAPALTRRRALTLNVTRSTMANVVPLGGVAGGELNRRMMHDWGIDGRGFSGYRLLTRLWDAGSKLLLPAAAVGVLLVTGEGVASPLRVLAVLGASSFAVVVGAATLLVLSPRCAVLVGRAAEQAVALASRAARRERRVDLVQPLLDLRRDCTDLIARGWLQMSLGVVGYLALQGVLLGLCLHLTGGGNSWPEVLAGFALERLLTMLPLTPGGVGLADLGLIGTLLAFGGDPVGVAAGAILYRVFVFALEIPVGGSALGLWFLGHRLAAPPPVGSPRAPTRVQRVAHVTDVFLPRLGGVETYVDDLARHQRAGGLEAEVLTPTRGGGDDPAWVRRISLREAREVVADYDVAHIHVSVVSPYSIRVARAAVAAGVPTLIIVHSMWAGAEALVGWVVAAPVRRAPVAWAAVSAPAADIVGRTLDVEVAVLPNALDVDSWYRDCTPAPAAPDLHVPGPDPGPVTLISVMRLVPRKRPLQLLRVFAQVRELTPGRDVRLVIVGEGRARRRVERHLQRHGLADQVRLTGRLPRSEVLGELRAASIYLAPARKESFGIAALEARCAGLPVVGHRASGVRDFVRDRVDGALVDDDLEMTAAVADLVVDDDLRERITSHNVRVRPALEWVDTLRRTEVLYREAALLLGTREEAGDVAAVTGAHPGTRSPAPAAIVQEA